MGEAEGRKVGSSVGSSLGSSDGSLFKSTPSGSTYVKEEGFGCVTGLSSLSVARSKSTRRTLGDSFNFNSL